MTCSATLCSAWRVCAKCAGVSGRRDQAPSQRQAHHCASSTSERASSSHRMSPPLTGETTGRAKEPSSSVVGSSANHGGSVAAGNEGASTLVSYLPPPRPPSASFPAFRAAGSVELLWSCERMGGAYVFGAHLGSAHPGRLLLASA